MQKFTEHPLMMTEETNLTNVDRHGPIFTSRQCAQQDPAFDHMLQGPTGGHHALYWSLCLKDSLSCLMKLP